MSVASQFAGKDYLIAHGTHDGTNHSHIRILNMTASGVVVEQQVRVDGVTVLSDNVHFMHMAQLVNALMQEEIQFRQLVSTGAHCVMNDTQNVWHSATNAILTRVPTGTLLC